MGCADFRRWAAWRSVHPKLFDPELFPETVPPPPPPAEERFEIPGDFPLDILDEGLDPVSQRAGSADPRPSAWA